MTSVIDDLRMLRREWELTAEDEIGLALGDLEPRCATLAIRSELETVVVLAVQRLPGEPAPTLPEATGHLSVIELPMDNGGSWIEVSAPIAYIGPFSALAAYGLSQARAAEPNGPQGLLKAIDELCDLFTRPAPRRLDTKRLAALYAELRVLETLLEAGISSALDHWTGPNEDPHDFTGLPGGDIEVKSTLSPDRTVITVNGLMQLESPEQGELLLVMMRLERDGSPSSDRLRNLIDRIEPKVDEVEFLRKLSDSGYDFSDTDGDQPQQPIREPAFKLVEVFCHRVDEKFPRLVPASLVEGRLPEDIDRLRYSVDIGSIPILDAPWTDTVKEMGS